MPIRVGGAGLSAVRNGVEGRVEEFGWKLDGAVLGSSVSAYTSSFSKTPHQTPIRALVRATHTHRQTAADMSTHNRAQRRYHLIKKFKLTDAEATRFQAEYDHLVPFGPGQLRRCVDSFRAREARGEERRHVQSNERIRLTSLLRDQFRTRLDRMAELEDEKLVALESQVEAVRARNRAALARERAEDELKAELAKEDRIRDVPRALRDAELEWHWEAGGRGEPSYWLVHTETGERWALAKTLGEGVGVSLMGDALVLWGLCAGRVVFMGMPDLGTGKVERDDADVVTPSVAAVESPVGAEELSVAAVEPPVGAEEQPERLYRVQVDEADEDTGSTMSAQLSGLELGDSEEGTV